ncbi:hypothetical protein Metlim_1237 [Methanoplanus limicola DSM 2279]|uniref:Uncharacterized protein n=1 Tax=Methanoplanus limicola DSM 2279 TaxID=937775 RepID=H1Z180_9EURY|nr:hypothetical protein Metlim_1237 [Methanoplanus limicola DSM 2279]
MWGILGKFKDKAQALESGNDTENWLKSFEKETKEYYRNNPEKVSGFYDRGKGKNGF